MLYFLNPREIICTSVPAGAHVTLYLSSVYKPENSNGLFRP